MTKLFYRLSIGRMASAVGVARLRKCLPPGDDDDADGDRHGPGRRRAGDADRGSLGVFVSDLFSNRFLLVGIAFELALAVALVYVPGLNRAFHQAPIPVGGGSPLIVWAPVVFFAEEARKAIVRKRRAAGRSA